MMRQETDPDLKNRRLTFISVPSAANLSDGEDRDVMTPRITTAKHKGRQTLLHDKELKKTEGLNTHEVIREKHTDGENKVQVNRIN